MGSHQFLVKRQKQERQVGGALTQAFTGDFCGESKEGWGSNLGLAGLNSGSGL